MLGDEAVMKLKRSMSDGDHLIPMGEMTPPRSPEKKTPLPKNRYNRSFSWSKLTDSLKGKRGPSSRSSRSSRSSHTPSIDKRGISGPILDPKSPLCPPRPKTPISKRPAAQSSPATPKRNCVSSASRHSYSASDPTNYSSPRLASRVHRPSPPPPLPINTSFESKGSTLIDSPLERIAESPHEPHETLLAKPLRLDKVYRYLEDMEPARLQPPNMGGTKGRAMQQAKDMELLVAERAKRGGEEPPPYDFYELIGKGAYGRVYKG